MIDFDAYNLYCDISLLDAKEVLRSGESVLHIVYPLGKEKEIEELLLENLPHILPLPDSRIHDHLRELKSGLDELFA